MKARPFGSFAVHRLRIASFALAGILACAVGTASADDDDIVNAGGFELPFTTVFLGTGQLEGQVNPAGEGQILPPGQWLTTGATAASTATVQSTVFAPGGGVQAVRVNRAASEDNRWAVPVNHLGYPDYPNPFPPEPAQPCIAITWDMRVEQSAVAAGSTGPFFGVEAFDDSGNAAGLLGYLGVNATSGAVVYQAPGTGFLTETGSLVNFGQWNRFQIELNYAAHQYAIFHNATPLGVFTFVDDALYPGQLNELTDAAIAAFGGESGLPFPPYRPPVRGAYSPPPRPPFLVESLAKTGTAYFDNFLVREGPCIIPEPKALVLAALTAVVCPRAIRRRVRA